MFSDFFLRRLFFLFVSMKANSFGIPSQMPYSLYICTIPAPLQISACLLIIIIMCQLWSSVTPLTYIKMEAFPPPNAVLLHTAYIWLQWSCELLTTCTHSIRGRRTDWFPERLTTQAGVSGVASSSAITASIPILLLWGGHNAFPETVSYVYLAYLGTHHVSLGFCSTTCFGRLEPCLTKHWKSYFTPSKMCMCFNVKTTETERLANCDANKCPRFSHQQQHTILYNMHLLKLQSSKTAKKC